MYYDFFNVKEFIIDKNLMDIPLHVITKLEKFHKPIINPIRYRMNIPVYVSSNSGYRPKQWELDNGRDGSSQHTFIGLGAVDYTSEDMDLLLHELRQSDYKRICYYPSENFVHCDHKGDDYNEFEVDKNGIWQYKGKRR